MKERLSDKLSIISPNVNIIRFFAAIGVIISHSFYVAENKPDFLYVFSNGQINIGGVAVGIFFFYSGLYVTKSLAKTQSVTDFMFKRCIRIFPQLWIVVVACVLFMGPIWSNRNIIEYYSCLNTYKYLLNGLLIPVHNLPGVFENNIYDSTVNGPLWTMPIEFMAYCSLAFVWAIWFYAFKKKISQKYLHIVALCSSMLLFVVAFTVLKHDMLIQVMRPVVIFFMGVIYYDYAEKIILDVRIAIIEVLIIVLACRIGGLSFALILFLPYVIATFSLALKQCKVSCEIFNISYEMYLVGWPIQQSVSNCFGGTVSVWLNNLITIPIDIVIAIGIYKMVMRKKI